MSDIFSQAAQIQQVGDNANKASYASLSTLRIVSKVLGGVLHHSEGMSPNDLEKYSQKMLHQIGQQTARLSQKLELPAENSALASITGSVAEVVSEHYRRVGAAALDMDWVDTLTQAAKIEGVWNEHHQPQSGSKEIRRSMAMMEALAPIISAHSRFSYWQPEASTLLDHIGSKLWLTVSESIEKSPVADRMDENEREILRTNLLRRAGELYADSWDSQAAGALAEYKESPASQRRAWAIEGYPLTEVDARFQTQYHMLNEALTVSLHVHSGIDQAQDDSETPSLS